MTIAALSVSPLNVEMNEPFEIATGTKTEVENVLVRLTLRDGTVGYGEGAPMHMFNGDTQHATLKAISRQKNFLIGKPVGRFRPLLEELDERLGPKLGSAKAALSMAILDAWSKQARMPLRLLFGGAQTKIHTDVTVTLGTPAQAKEAAKKIMALGVRAIKIKVGKDVDEDVERIEAVSGLSRRLSLLLDANCGYTPKQSLSLLAKLKRRKIIPDLFEQPAAKEDWKGLAEVHAKSGVAVAADESVSTRAEAWKMARVRAAQVVNIKLMKCGILEAWDIALICRAAGLRLMIGGMVESALAMGASAHFAAGLGGFDFVDLDTPLWFKKNPMRGLNIGRGGVYDLAQVKAGIGVSPLQK